MLFTIINREQADPSTRLRLHLCTSTSTPQAFATLNGYLTVSSLRIHNFLRLLEI